MQQPIRSNVKITLRYLGRCSQVKRFSANTVEVVQQHCGGNTVSLFKGELKERGENLMVQNILIVWSQFHFIVQGFDMHIHVVNEPFIIFIHLYF